MSPFRRFRVVLVATLTVLIIALTSRSAMSQGNVNDNAWVVMNGHWALTAYDVGGSRGIVTYLPTGILLFNVDRSETYNDGEQRVRALTQDGVLLAVKDALIKPLSVFGSRDYMAHSTFSICVNPNCDLDEDPTTEIRPGDAFSVRSHDAGATYAVFTNRTTTSDIQIGYIAGSKLDELARVGIVTNLRQQHPRYQITRKDSNAVNNKCAEGPEASRLATAEDGVNIVDKVALMAFGYGEIEDRDNGRFDIQIDRSYGKNGEANEFRIYAVRELSIPNSPQNLQNFIFIAEVNFRCDEFNDPVFIKNVRLIQVKIAPDPPGDTHKLDLGNGTIFSIPTHTLTDLNTTVVFLPWGTPGNMSGNQFNRHPYLWSVNTPTQYFDLMGVLSDKLSNRSLAGFFLSEFNRSCPSKKQHGRATDPVCVNHSYSGSMP